uniref:Uncharacterized protein n=1 Tax=Chromera velia CCMP2878 TaxID=1169474 RepID=A0A0G4GB89_9ALVE|eukprot:Cvel_21121.t1-p1 / transcript=Cvel_21121.t1 / gene=Cvel_21121 / organism=Chromera_velia_CCMP2878 / gene_product=E3 ubiquitin-protein ligase RNF213, putative / transcript_product=E3 ubiquitin-protein ligase RNF213, putative / location=Cvel_scaffold1955:779-33457(+) / protein_length=6749 / sequence_SO=supercontig / SO=protein_coding / is_pseudo=false
MNPSNLADRRTARVHLLVEHPQEVASVTLCLEGEHHELKKESSHASGVFSLFSSYLPVSSESGPTEVIAEFFEEGQKKTKGGHVERRQSKKVKGYLELETLTFWHLVGDCKATTRLVNVVGEVPPELITLLRDSRGDSLKEKTESIRQLQKRDATLKGVMQEALCENLGQIPSFDAALLVLFWIGEMHSKKRRSLPSDIFCATPEEIRRAGELEWPSTSLLAACLRGKTGRYAIKNALRCIPGTDAQDEDEGDPTQRAVAKGFQILLVQEALRPSSLSSNGTSQTETDAERAKRGPVWMQALEVLVPFVKGGRGDLRGAEAVKKLVSDLVREKAIAVEEKVEQRTRETSTSSADTETVGEVGGPQSECLASPSRLLAGLSKARRLVDLLCTPGFSLSSEEKDEGGEERAGGVRVGKNADERQRSSAYATRVFKQFGFVSRKTDRGATEGQENGKKVAEEEDRELSKGGLKEKEGKKMGDLEAPGMGEKTGKEAVLKVDGGVLTLGDGSEGSRERKGSSDSLSSVSDKTDDSTMELLQNLRQPLFVSLFSLVLLHEMEASFDSSPRKKSLPSPAPLGARWTLSWISVISSLGLTPDEVRDVFKCVACKGPSRSPYEKRAAPERHSKSAPFGLFPVSVESVVTQEGEERGQRKGEQKTETVTYRLETCDFLVETIRKIPPEMRQLPMVQTILEAMGTQSADKLQLAFTELRLFHEDERRLAEGRETEDEREKERACRNTSARGNFGEKVGCEDNEEGEAAGVTEEGSETEGRDLTENETSSSKEGTAAEVQKQKNESLSKDEGHTEEQAQSDEAGKIAFDGFQAPSKKKKEDDACALTTAPPTGRHRTSESDDRDLPIEGARCFWLAHTPLFSDCPSARAVSEGGSEGPSPPMGETGAVSDFPLPSPVEGQCPHSEAARGGADSGEGPDAQEFKGMSSPSDTSADPKSAVGAAMITPDEEEEIEAEALFHHALRSVASLLRLLPRSTNLFEAFCDLHSGLQRESRLPVAHLTAFLASRSEVSLASEGLEVELEVAETLLSRCEPQKKWSEVPREVKEGQTETRMHMKICNFLSTGSFVLWIFDAFLEIWGGGAETEGLEASLPKLTDLVWESLRAALRSPSEKVLRHIFNVLSDEMTEDRLTSRMAHLAILASPLLSKEKQREVFQQNEAQAERLHLGLSRLMRSPSALHAGGVSELGGGTERRDRDRLDALQEALDASCEVQPFGEGKKKGSDTRERSAVRFVSSLQVSAIAALFEGACEIADFTYLIGESQKATGARCWVQFLKGACNVALRVLKDRDDECSLPAAIFGQADTEIENDTDETPEARSQGQKTTVRVFRSISQKFSDSRAWKVATDFSEKLGQKKFTVGEASKLCRESVSGGVSWKQIFRLALTGELLRSASLAAAVSEDDDDWEDNGSYSASANEALTSWDALVPALEAAAREAEQRLSLWKCLDADAETVCELLERLDVEDREVCVLEISALRDATTTQNASLWGRDGLLDREVLPSRFRNALEKAFAVEDPAGVCAQKRLKRGIDLSAERGSLISAACASKAFLRRLRAAAVMTAERRRGPRPVAARRVMKSLPRLVRPPESALEESNKRAQMQAFFDEELRQKRKEPRRASPLDHQERSRLLPEALFDSLSEIGSDEPGGFAQNEKSPDGEKAAEEIEAEEQGDVADEDAQPEAADRVVMDARFSAEDLLCSVTDSLKEVIDDVRTVHRSLVEGGGSGAEQWKALVRLLGGRSAFDSQDPAELWRSEAGEVNTILAYGGSRLSELGDGEIGGTIGVALCCLKVARFVESVSRVSFRFLDTVLNWDLFTHCAFEEECTLLRKILRDLEAPEGPLGEIERRESDRNHSDPLPSALLGDSPPGVGVSMRESVYDRTAVATLGETSEAVATVLWGLFHSGHEEKVGVAFDTSTVMKRVGSLLPLCGALERNAEHLRSLLPDSRLDEDLRTLEGAVEETGDDFIRTDTVSSLTEAQRFLRPLIKHVNSKMGAPSRFVSLLENQATKYAENFRKSRGADGKDLKSATADLCGHLDTCGQNWMALDRLISSVSNRSATLAERVESFMLKGGVMLSAKRGDEHVTAEGYFPDPIERDRTWVLSIDDLTDLRSRMFLKHAQAPTKTGVPSTEEEEEEEKDQAGINESARAERQRNFIDLVNALVTAAKNLEELRDAGHILIVSVSEVYANPSALGLLGQLNSWLEVMLVDWKASLKRAWKEHYELTLFSARQLWVLDSFLESKLENKKKECDKTSEEWESVQETCDLLQLLGVSAETAKRASESFPVESTEGGKDVDGRLTRLGLFLAFCRVGGTCPPRSRVSLPPLVTLVQKDVVQMGKPCVFEVDNGSQMIRLVLSLFANFKTTPADSNLLFCSADTSAADIEAFLARCFLSRAAGLSEADHLFCVVRVEALPFALQQLLAEGVHRWREEEGDKFFLAFVVVRETRESVLLESFAGSGEVVRSQGLPRGDAEKVLKAMAQECVVVRSHRPGCGKTERILRECRSRGLLALTFPGTERFHRREVIRSLRGRLSDRTKRREETAARLGGEENLPDWALHFDLAPVRRPEELSDFLFQLLALKVTSAGGAVLLNPFAACFLEIPNAHARDLIREVPILSLLPVRECLFRIEDFVVSRNPASPEQVVAKYLDALNVQPLHVQSAGVEQDQSIERRDVQLIGLGSSSSEGTASSSPLSDMRVRSLLNRFVLQKGELQKVMSFSLLRACLRCLAEQFASMSASSFFSTETLRVLRVDPSVRRMLVTSILDTSLSSLTDNVVDMRKESRKEAEDTGKVEEIPKGECLAQHTLTRMAKWEDRNQLMCLFHRSDRSTLSLLYRDASLVLPELRNLLSSQELSAAQCQHASAASGQRPFAFSVMGPRPVAPRAPFVDYKSLSSDHLKARLSRIVCTSLHSLSSVDAGILRQGAAEFCGYVMTVDNFLKMVLIALRLSNRIPVCVMGETGCGKTSVVKYLAAASGVHFFCLNVHAGTTEDRIDTFMQEVIHKAELQEEENDDEGLGEEYHQRWLEFYDQVMRYVSQGVGKGSEFYERWNDYRRQIARFIESWSIPGSRYGQQWTDYHEEVKAFIRDMDGKERGSECHQRWTAYHREVVRAIKEGSTHLPTRLPPKPKRTKKKKKEKKTQYQSGKQTVWAFFDEINTCDHLWLLCEILTRHSFRGTPLPPNLAVLSACNPYKFRETGRCTERVGLALDTRQGLTVREGNAERGQGENLASASKAAAAAVLHRPRVLKYKVHPLPESLLDFVWDFGSLDGRQQRQYIHSMAEQTLERAGSIYSGRWAHVFAEVLCEAQRQSEYLLPESSVSLRDVKRCCDLFIFFRNGELRATATEVSYFTQPNKFDVARSALEVPFHNLRAFFLSLSVCYICRVPEEEGWRKISAAVCQKISKAVLKAWEQSAGSRQYCAEREALGRLMQVGKAFAKMRNIRNLTDRDSDRLTELGFLSIVQAKKTALLDQMDLPPGIAKNRSLQENVFVALTCVLNRIPLMMVGRPGESKTLSVQLLHANMRGQDSKSEFFRELPECYPCATSVLPQCYPCATSVLPQCYPCATFVLIQCYPCATPVFQRALVSQKKEKGARFCVLLDEIGLAEQSPHNPLKVLHSLLEPDYPKDRPEVAVIGISNYELDPAKMNRAIHLMRPAPMAGVLKDTARTIAKSCSDAVMEEEAKRNGRSSTSSPFSEAKHLVHRLLRALCDAYEKYIRKQPLRDFHGLRDFYSLVKAFARAAVEAEKAEAKTSYVRLMAMAVQRNFAGVPFKPPKLPLMPPLPEADAQAESQEHSHQQHLHSQNGCQVQPGRDRPACSLDPVGLRGAPQQASLTPAERFQREPEGRLRDLSGETRRRFREPEGGSATMMATLISRMKGEHWREEDYAETPIAELIAANFADRFARNLLLVLRGSDEGAIEVIRVAAKKTGGRRVEVLMGSPFPGDTKDKGYERYQYVTLNKIILHMEQGGVLVLKNLENIYGALYDMLNQNYQVSCGKRHCRIALGPFNNPMCHVHEDFRCVVLLSEDALWKADPPFLNRFEKQVLEVGRAGGARDARSHCARIDAVVHELSSVCGDTGPLQGPSSLSARFHPRHLIPGFSNETTALIEDIIKSRLEGRIPDPVELQAIEQTAEDEVFRLATPEGMLRIRGALGVKGGGGVGEAVVSRVREMPRRDLSDYLSALFRDDESVWGFEERLALAWARAQGKQNAEKGDARRPSPAIITKSALIAVSGNFLDLEEISAQASPSPSLVRVCHLAAFSTEMDLERELRVFLADSEKERDGKGEQESEKDRNDATSSEDEGLSAVTESYHLLLLVCSPRSELLTHCKNHVDTAVNDYMQVQSHKTNETDQQRPTARKHVVVLLLGPRSSLTSSDYIHQFPLGGGWGQMHLESVTPQVPPLESLLVPRLVDVLHHLSTRETGTPPPPPPLPFKEAIREIILPCMWYMRYPQSLSAVRYVMETAEHIRSSTFLCNEILWMACKEDPQLRGPMRDEGIVSAAPSVGGGGPPWWWAVVAGEGRSGQHRLGDGETVHASLVAFVREKLRVPLAKALFLLEKNGALGSVAALVDATSAATSEGEDSQEAEGLARLQSIWRRHAQLYNDISTVPTPDRQEFFQVPVSIGHVQLPFSKMAAERVLQETESCLRKLTHGGNHDLVSVFEGARTEILSQLRDGRFPMALEDLDFFSTAFTSDLTRVKFSDLSGDPTQKEKVIGACLGRLRPHAFSKGGGRKAAWGLKVECATAKDTGGPMKIPIWIDRAILLVYFSNFLRPLLTATALCPRSHKIEVSIQRRLTNPLLRRRPSLDEEKASIQKEVFVSCCEALMPCVNAFALPLPEGIFGATQVSRGNGGVKPMAVRREGGLQRWVNAIVSLFQCLHAPLKLFMQEAAETQSFDETPVSLSVLQGAVSFFIRDAAGLQQEVASQSETAGNSSLKMCDRGIKSPVEVLEGHLVETVIPTAWRLADLDGGEGEEEEQAEKRDGRETAPQGLKLKDWLECLLGAQFLSVPREWSDLLFRSSILSAIHFGTLSALPPKLIDLRIGSDPPSVPLFASLFSHAHPVDIRDLIVNVLDRLPSVLVDAEGSRQPSQASGESKGYIRGAALMACLRMDADSGHRFELAGESATSGQRLLEALCRSIELVGEEEGGGEGFSGGFSEIGSVVGSLTVVGCQAQNRRSSGFVRTAGKVAAMATVVDALDFAALGGRSLERPQEKRNSICPFFNWDLLTQQPGECDPYLKSLFTQAVDFALWKFCRMMERVQDLEGEEGNVEDLGEDRRPSRVFCDFSGLASVAILRWFVGSLAAAVAAPLAALFADEADADEQSHKETQRTRPSAETKFKQLSDFLKGLDLQRLLQPKPHLSAVVQTLRLFFLRQLRVSFSRDALRRIFGARPEGKSPMKILREALPWLHDFFWPPPCERPSIAGCLDFCPVHWVCTLPCFRLSDDAAGSGNGEAPARTSVMDTLSRYCVDLMTDSAALPGPCVAALEAAGGVRQGERETVKSRLLRALSIPEVLGGVFVLRLWEERLTSSSSNCSSVREGCLKGLDAIRSAWGAVGRTVTREGRGLRHPIATAFVHFLLRKGEAGSVLSTAFRNSLKKMSGERGVNRAHELTESLVLQVGCALSMAEALPHQSNALFPFVALLRTLMRGEEGRDTERDKSSGSKQEGLKLEAGISVVAASFLPGMPVEEGTHAAAAVKESATRHTCKCGIESVRESLCPECARPIPLVAQERGNAPPIPGGKASRHQMGMCRGYVPLSGSRGGLGWMGLVPLHIRPETFRVLRLLLHGSLTAAFVLLLPGGGGALRRFQRGRVSGEDKALEVSVCEHFARLLGISLKDPVHRGQILGPLMGSVSADLLALSEMQQGAGGEGEMHPSAEKVWRAYLRVMCILREAVGGEGLADECEGWCPLERGLFGSRSMRVEWERSFEWCVMESEGVRGRRAVGRMEEDLQWRLVVGGQAWSQLERDVEEVVESPLSRPDGLHLSGVSDECGNPPGGRIDNHCTDNSGSQGDGAETQAACVLRGGSGGSSVGGVQRNEATLSVSTVEKYLSVAIPASLWRSRPLTNSPVAALEEEMEEQEEGEEAEDDAEGSRSVSSTALQFLRRRWKRDPEEVRLRFPWAAAVAQHAQNFHLLAHVPALLAWPRALIDRFSQKISREEAKKTSVDRLLSGMPEKFSDVFDQFSSAWNACVAAGLAKRNVREEMSPVVIPKRMSRKVPVAFSCLGRHREGTGLLRLLEDLCGLQDNFLDSFCDNVAAARAQEAEQEESRGKVLGVSTSGEGQGSEREGEGSGNREGETSRQPPLPPGLLEGASALRLAEAQNRAALRVAVPQSSARVVGFMEDLIRECLVGGLGALPPQPQHAGGGGGRWAGEGVAVLRGGFSLHSDVWMLPGRERELHWGSLEGQLRSLFGGVRRLQRPFSRSLSEEEGGTFRFSGDFSQSKYFLKTFAETIPQVPLPRDVAVLLPECENESPASFSLSGGGKHGSIVLTKELDFSSVLVSHLSRMFHGDSSDPLSLGPQQRGDVLLGQFLESEEGAAICGMVAVPPLFEQIQHQLRLKHLAAFHEYLEQSHAELEIRALVEGGRGGNREAVRASWGEETVGRLEKEIEKASHEVCGQLAADLRRFLVRFLRSPDSESRDKLVGAFATTENLRAVIGSCVNGGMRPHEDPSSSSAVRVAVEPDGGDRVSSVDGSVSSPTEGDGGFDLLVKEIAKFGLQALPWIVTQLCAKERGGKGKGREGRP